jgi:dTDP-4-dehydrorhamnose reductase
VINCANLAGGVDFCEANPGMSRKFHAEGTRMLGEESLKYNAAFVFISTDYVFDGSQPPYTEEDLPNPLNVYGKNKLEAEEWIKNNLSNYVIARTTNVYGWDPHTTTPNFLMGLFFRLSRNEAVSVPAYLYGTPTLADDLAIVITELLQAGKSGLFHITGPDLVSRYEWAAGFCSVMNLPLPLLKKADVPPANMVPRPFRSHLISRKLDLTLRKKLNGVSNGLSLFRKEYEKHS